MAQPVVGVVGARALRRDLNRLATDTSGPLYKAMKQAGLEAVTPVVAATRAELPRSDRPDSATHTSGALAASVRASGTKSGGAVRMGSKRVPYAGWMEFGGTRRRPHDSSRPFVPGGNYLWPAARGLRSRVADDYSKALERVFSSSGVWTNTTASGGAVHD